MAEPSVHTEGSAVGLAAEPTDQDNDINLELQEAAALVCDINKLIVSANKAMGELVNTFPEQLVGRSVSGLLSGKDPDLMLRRSDASEIPVRALQIATTDTDLQTIVLIDMSDLSSARKGADQEARLIEAQRIARVGSWSVDLATNSVMRSAVLLEMFSEVDHNPLNDFFSGVHSDDLPLVHRMYDDLLNARTEEPIEIEVHSANRNRTYLCRAQGVFGPTGKVERLVGTVQDITDQRALEHELRTERRRLSDAQRVASIGTWEWNTVTGQVAWSHMLREVLGVSRTEEATYDKYLSLVHPDDRGWLSELWQQMVADCEPAEFEHRILRADGQVRVLRCHAAADSGSVKRQGLTLVGTAQDITEQRATETRMRLSSQRFTDLVAVTPVGIGLFDETRRLVDANDALCNLLGRNLERMRGMTVAQLTHPSGSASWLPSATEMTDKQGLGYQIPQVIMLRADGEPVYCELHIAISVQDDGATFWLVVFQDITERRRVAEALRHQATHDDLTGLPNRAAVKDMLGRLLRGESASKVAVLFCDIDNFKRVNDSLGHDAGDELLVALARRLENGMPKGCIAARLSGDEYVIICKDYTKVGGIETLANKVAGLLRAAVPVQGQLVKVSASIGAAVPNEISATSADLLRFADAAMFEAKRSGAGRISLANAALMASANRQMRLEGQLRDALASNGLAVYYQPVVGMDGTVLTAEALVRWPHPERGLLAPDVFLPIAEQGDLLRDLDKWVLRTALAEASNWPTPGGQPIAVAVNLSGLMPGDPDFVDTVADAVAKSGISWDRVVLELVETALIDLPSRTRQAMADLVERGVRFAVDDFGTGYSSLARLKDLPAQIIKLDRRFVSGIGTDAVDFAVARAVVDMAKAMGRSCVAEGVETPTQFTVLNSIGVDAYQGWLFARPLPLQEFKIKVAGSPLTPQAAE